MAQIIASGRGRILIHHGFQYQCNRRRETAIYWRCNKTHCRTGLTTNVFDVHDANAVIVVNRVGQHDHVPAEEQSQRQVVVNEMKDTIQSNPTIPVRRVYDDIVAAQHQAAAPGAVLSLPRFDTVKSTLNRKRSAIMPPAPRNLQNVVVQGEWAVTWRGERYLLYQDNTSGILVFATDADIRLLLRCDVIFADGTFRSTPRPYAQFFTVHGALNNYVLKFACGLLADKTAASYRTVFRVLKTAAMDLTAQQLSPRTVIIDFEEAIINALRSEFPATGIAGCYFHFSKALWRNVQRHGLQHDYQNDLDLKTTIRKLMALGFIPLSFVLICYRNLRAEPVTNQVLAMYPQLGLFFAYFEQTWLNENATFPPRLWNVYNRRMEFRTNNHVESFHSRWNTSVGVRHPSLWVFMRKLKDGQANHETRVDEMSNGEQPPIRRLKWRKFETRIVTLREQFQNGAKTMDEYWRAMRHTIAEFAVV